MKRSRKGDTFRKARSATEPLAIRPEALSIYWAWGVGTENEVRGVCSIVTIEGPLEQRASWWDGYDAIVERFKAACAEEMTSTIVLRIDSPGGDCAGLYEAVRMMRELKAKSGKRVVAYADESAYSAAYALACVADEIYLPPSGGVGSVGVIAVCLDRVALNEAIGINVAVVHAGARKADCHPDVPLSSDAISGVQEDVDALAGMFRELVAEGRGVDADAVAALEAGCFMGADALAVDLADGVMGFDELLVMLADDNNQEEGADMTTAKSARENGKIKAGDVDANDSLAKPQVAQPSATALSAAAASLKAEDKEEKKAEDEEEEEEATSSEEEEEGEEEAEEDCEEEEEEDEEEEEEAAAATVPATSISARTQIDVIKCVRDLTGETSPAAQVGALTALRDKAARVGKLTAQVAKLKSKHSSTELKSVVESGVRSGKLEPTQRAWAMSQPVASVRAYLKNASPKVARTPLRQNATKAANRKEQTDPTAAIDESIANVARTMQMDPAKIAAHAADLRKAGVIH